MDIRELKKNYPFHLLTVVLILSIILVVIARNSS
jgi:uncharacterized membrane protein YwaF